jgi:hypothetical protein
MKLEELKDIIHNAARMNKGSRNQQQQWTGCDCERDYEEQNDTINTTVSPMLRFTGGVWKSCLSTPVWHTDVGVYSDLSFTCWQTGCSLLSRHSILVEVRLWRHSRSSKHFHQHFTHVMITWQTRHKQAAANNQAFVHPVLKAAQETETT